jgi:hypothetical protein
VSAAFDGDGRVVSYVETDTPSTTTNYTYDSFLYDNLGDTIGQFSFIGNTSLTYRALYNAFGQTEKSSGTASVFGFQGMMQNLIAPSGIFALDYDNARWYDPAGAQSSGIPGRHVHGERQDPGNYARVERHRSSWRCKSGRR